MRELLYSLGSDETWIQGIGNEVLIALCAIVLVCLLVILIFIWNRRSSASIHPDNQDAVNYTRAHLLRFSNRFFNSGETSESNGDLVVDSVQYFGMDNQCPICLQEPRYPIETNCGHLFCANCVVAYWRPGNWIQGPVACPVCRQQVTLLLQCFRPDASEDEEQQQQRDQLLQQVNDYNRRFSGGPRPILDYLWDLPALLRHLSAEFFTVGGLMYMFRIRIVLCFVAAIMYLISPLDMIPEAVFGLLGLLDDIFVVLLLAIYVTIIYRRFLVNRWEEGI